MKKLLYVMYFVSLLFGTLQSQAQVLSKADKHFNSFAYQDAIELYEILWQKDNSNEYLTKQLAVSYQMVNNTEKAEEWYARLIPNQNVNAEDILNYARALQSNGKYDQAKLYMDRYLELDQAKDLKPINLDYITALKKDSGRYSIAPIAVNSEASDFGTAYYKDRVVFSSAKAKTTLIKRNYRWNEQNYLRLYSSDPKEDDDLTNSELLSSKLGTNYHDGPVCFNEIGDEMFLTRNYVSESKRAKRNDEGVVSIQLYHCSKNGNDWSTPELMSLNIEGYSTGHPSLSKDGKRLYFISNRPGGVGGTDIYYSDKKGDTWGDPVNAGKLINTSENEMFPFISANNTLYFASKGHAGLGGLDIFYLSGDSLASPVNMGYPINTSKDDFALILKNGSGYLSSNREKGESYDDIYHFKILSRIIRGQVFNSETNEILGNTKVSLQDKAGNVINEMTTSAVGKFKFVIDNVQDFKLKSVKELFTNGVGEVNSSELEDQAEVVQNLFQTPDNKLQLKGLVVYREDRSPVKDVNITIKNRKSTDLINLISDINGQFSCELLRDMDYTIEYRKKGILSKSRRVETSNIEGNEIYVEEEVDKIQVGKVFVLDNIFYDLNKSNIRTDAAIELDKLVVVMTENPTLKIELSSHTDSRGSDPYNMALSSRRAKEAVEYIVSKGISPDRLEAKGYGETKLINRCSNGVKCSKAEHQANRRTEVKILEM